MSACLLFSLSTKVPVSFCTEHLPKQIVIVQCYGLEAPDLDRFEKGFSTSAPWTKATFETGLDRRVALAARDIEERFARSLEHTSQTSPPLT
jgi:hypothetical protein